MSRKKYREAKAISLPQAATKNIKKYLDTSANVVLACLII